MIGNAEIVATEAPCWRVTWAGWRGGVIPVRQGGPLAETGTMALAPAVAAAVCAGKALAYHAGDHPMAGRRDSALRISADPTYGSYMHPGLDAQDRVLVRAGFLSVF